MKTLRLALIAIATATAIGACADQPTAPIATDNQPSFNGIMLGSGHRNDSDTTTTTTTTAGDGAPTASDTTGRGGIMLGSGN